MSREALIVWLAFLVLAAGSAVVMKAYLLYKATQSRLAASSQEANSPERIVADDILLDSSSRIVLALAATGIGLLFIYLVVHAPPPPNLDGTYDITQSTMILLLLLTTISMVEALQGVRGVVTLHRLNAAIEVLRRPPEACQVTTFEGCPYISPERLAEIQADARVKIEAIVDQAQGIADDLEQLSPEGK